MEVVSWFGMRPWLFALLAVGIQSADASGRVHAGLSCGSCHAESAQRTRVTSAGERVTAAVNCGHCHLSEAKAFAASQHGQAADGGPACTTCHAAHYLKTAEQIERQCFACHTAPPLFFMNPVPRIAGKVSCMNCHSAHSD